MFAAGGHALLTEPTALDVFRPLDIPVLYMVGKESTQPALGVARILTHALPSVEVREFEGLGHMGPITHPRQVNAVVAGILPGDTFQTIVAWLPWTRSHYWRRSIPA